MGKSKSSEHGLRRTESDGNGTASVRLVRALAYVVERAGGSRDCFLRAAQLDATQLDASGARVPLTELYRLLDFVLEHTGDPALGLHWSERFRGDAFAPLSHLVAHSASLRHGLEAVARFQRMFSDSPGYQLLVRDDKAVLRVSPRAEQSVRVQRFVAEMVTSSLLRVIRAFNRHARAERVSFAYSAPDYHGEYTRIFGTAVGFDQPFTEVEFDGSLLDASPPHRDPDVYEAMHALAESRVRCQTHGSSYALRVRAFLVQQGSPRRLAMKTVARGLGVSVRSLRRQLSLEGKPYESVRDDALALLAKQLLRDRQLTIQETAFELGFSATSTFHRAFKRWTGTTPSAYRNAGSPQRRDARRT